MRRRFFKTLYIISFLCFKFLISEAAYAYKLKRHVIPLMLGDAYEPDGWLALMIGTQEYLRFCSENDTECNMPLLIAAIEKTGAVQRES